MIDKDKLIEFLNMCIFNQNNGSELNFLELAKYKIMHGDFYLGSEKIIFRDYDIHIGGNTHRITIKKEGGIHYKDKDITQSLAKFIDDGNLDLLLNKETAEKLSD